MRAASCPQPAIEFRLESGERQHTVLKFDLMERANVETLALARLSTLTHLAPLYPPERIGKDKSRQPADERDRLCGAFARTHGHGLTEIVCRLLNSPALELQPQ